MAIIVDNDVKKGSWMPIVLVAFFTIVIVAGTYFLFFAPVPLIETISSPELRSATQISVIKLNPNEIVTSPVVLRLRSQVSLPPQGSFGRSNPFIPFNQTPPTP